MKGETSPISALTRHLWMWSRHPISSYETWVLERTRLSYERSRRIKAESPYTREIYARLIEEILEGQRHCIVLPMAEYLSGRLDRGKINLVIRHDIDTRDCLEGLERVLTVNRRFDLRVALYFRVDGKEYSIRDYAPQIHVWKDEGHEIGLHTLAYTCDRIEEAFGREHRLFHEVLGFHPKTFTLHGLGKLHYENRLKFLDRIDHFIETYRYLGSDNKQGYRYVIHDCHFVDGRRVLMDDFEMLPSFLRGGDSVLILTHPCYWI